MIPLFWLMASFMLLPLSDLPDFLEEPIPDTMASFGFYVFQVLWYSAWAFVAIGLVLFPVVVCLLKEKLLLWPGLIGVRVELAGIGYTRYYLGQRIRKLQFIAGDDTAADMIGGQLQFNYTRAGVKKFGSSLDEVSGTALISAIQDIAIEQDLAPGMLDVIKAGAAKAVNQPDIEEPIAPTSVTSVALILANLFPIAGVLLFDWTVGHVLLLYWAESGIVGIYNIAKMWVIDKARTLLRGPLFFTHYGGFMAIHLGFIYIFMSEGFDGAATTIEEGLHDMVALMPALVALFISHGVSFYLNFLGRGEYVGRDIDDQVGEPYVRIALMQFVLIVGGGIALWLGAPVLLVIEMIAAKIYVDLRAHMGQHIVMGPMSIEMSGAD